VTREPPESSDASPSAWGPLHGILLGAALGVTAFLAAMHFLGAGSPRAEVEPPDGFRTGGGAGGAVPILVGALPSGVAAALVPLREDGVPGERDAALLNEALFPGGPPHRWDRLVLENAGEATATVDVGGGNLFLLGPGDARRGNADLAGALEARRAALPRHRRFDLESAGAGRRRLDIAPGASVRVLVAFPADAPDSPPADGLALGDARLVPAEATAESLRAALATGRLAALRVPSRDAAATRLAPAPRGATPARSASPSAGDDR
jgi:hypothetical protein